MISAALAMVILVFAYLAWPALLPGLIYFPRALEIADLSPESWGYAGEVVRIPAPGGDTVVGWMLRHTSSKPNDCVVLFTHGNAGNITSQAGFMRPFLAAGFDALVFDYRGYGASSGSASEEHLYEDAQLAYRYLVGDGIAPDHLLVVGHSLGTAVATELASRQESAGLVLAAPFTSLPDAMRTRVSWFPVGVLRWTRERFDAESRIARVSAPTLFVVASADRIVPEASARKLYESARGRTTWVEVPGGHNYVFRNGDFQAALERFRRQLPACSNTAIDSSNVG
jgi:pimeloyl-ACP methyl ester carboxylesterase